MDIGKIAISRRILAAEQNSLLGADRLDLTAIKQGNANGPHWLNELFVRLQDDAPLEKIEQVFSNLTIITFNYDRVIEHYLFHALRALGNLDQEDAARAMSHLKIVHPYGKIGRLPWQPDDGTPDLPFGEHLRLRHEALVASAQRLRTFTETVEDGEVLAAIHNGIVEANQLVFMGFSFLPQNLELMKGDRRTKATTIEATSFGESESKIGIARMHIARMARGPEKPQVFDHDVAWTPLKAGDYLRQNGNRLAS